MPIIAARRYTAGKPGDHAIAIDGTLRDALQPRQFDWIGLAQPSVDEMALVAAQFGLHPLAVEDALNPQQMPKVEVYGRHLFIVARTAMVEDGDGVGYGQTALFLASDFVVTVRFGSTRAHSDLRQRLEADHEHLAEGPDYVAHAILDFIVDGYQPIIEHIEETVQVLEERAILAFPDSATIRRIFRLRRHMRRFERIIGPMEELCDRLATTELPGIDGSAHIWFRDVLDHVRRTMARMSSLKDTLASIVETAGLLEQQRQGEMTRKLAAWAAILAVPTAIAGVYGMNFRFMPELEWQYGYFAVVGAMTAICTGLWWRFRKMGWI